MLGVWEGWSYSSPPLPDGKGVRRQVCVGGWLLTRIRCETRPFPSEEGGQLDKILFKKSAVFFKSSSALPARQLIRAKSKGRYWRRPTLFFNRLCPLMQALHAPQKEK
jgi:hypothetical protein